MSQHSYLNNIKKEFNETLIEILLSEKFEKDLKKIFPYLEMVFYDFGDYFF